MPRCLQQNLFCFQIYVVIDSINISGSHPIERASENKTKQNNLIALENRRLKNVVHFLYSCCSSQWHNSLAKAVRPGCVEMNRVCFSSGAAVFLSSWHKQFCFFPVFFFSQTKYSIVSYRYLYCVSFSAVIILELKYVCVCVYVYMHLGVYYIQIDR